LEQCNVRASLATESCKDCKERVELSFHWDAFGIEGMVGEKMVSSDLEGHGGAASPRLLTPGAGQLKGSMPLLLFF